MLTRPDSWTLATAPAAEPFTTDEAKAHLRVDGSDEDTLIDALVVAAREYLELVTSRALVNQTWKAYFSAWPCRGFELPGSPLSSVTLVKYTDTDAAQSTVDGSVYDVDTDATVGSVKLTEGQAWPSTSLQVNKPIVVEYVSGYGATSATIPQALKQAMLLHIGHMFENREQVVVGTIATDLPFAYDALIETYKVATL